MRPAHRVHCVDGRCCSGRISPPWPAVVAVAHQRWCRPAATPATAAATATWLAAALGPAELHAVPHQFARVATVIDARLPAPLAVTRRRRAAWPSPCAARTPRRSGATCLSAPYRPRGAWSDRSAVKPGNEFLGFPASMIRHSHADHRWWAGGPSLPGDVAASRDARGSERWSNDRNASEQAAIKAASRLPYVLCSHVQGAVERVVLGRARKRRGTARLSPAFLRHPGKQSLTRGEHGAMHADQHWLQAPDVGELHGPSSWAGRTCGATGVRNSMIGG